MPSRLNEIVDTMIRIAEGDWEARAPRSSDDEIVDAAAVGVNMLAEELSSRMVTTEYLEQVMDLAPDGIVLLAPDLHIRHANARAREFWNPSDGGLGSLLGDELTRDLRSALAARRFWRRELELPGAVEISVGPLPNGDAVGVIRDLSVAQERAGALRRLAYIAQNSSDGLIAVSKDSIITDWNAAAERLFGYTAAEAVGQNISLVVPAERLEELRAIRATHEGKTPSFETVRVHKDGSRVPVRISVSAILDDNRVIGSAAIIRDLREQQAASDAVRHSEDLLRGQEMERSRVARELHDGVNQTLVAAKLQLEQRDAPAERTLELLNEAIAEIRRISQELRPSVLDDIGLAAALRNVCERLRDRRDLNVTADCESPRLPDDVELGLFRIAQEALNNALQHSSATTIQVSLRNDGLAVHLCVIDDGKGFDSGMDSDGIGLRNIQHRTAQLNGILALDSTSAGTTLCVEVPVKPSE